MTELGSFRNWADFEQKMLLTGCITINSNLLKVGNPCRRHTIPFRSLKIVAILRSFQHGSSRLDFFAVIPDAVNNGSLGFFIFKLQGCFRLAKEDSLRLECVSNLVDDGSDGRHVSISGPDLGSRGHFALHLQVIRDLGHNMASGSGQRLIFGLGFGSGLKRIVGEAQVRRTAIVGSGFARLTEELHFGGSVPCTSHLEAG